MFGDYELSDFIAYQCNSIDILCRLELKNDTIVSERDYISVLCSRIRERLVNIFGMNCHAQTTTRTMETSVGVDGIIIFKYHDKAKIGIFEGKQPKLSKNDYNWDYLTKRELSHFSEQIEKQHIWLDTFAIWEMFFNEGASGHLSPPYDCFGSSCVWHSNAYNFMHTNDLIFKKWTTTNLSDLLTSSCHSFYSIIYDIVSCKAGKILKVDLPNSRISVSNTTNNAELSIPIPLEPLANQNAIIQRFLTRNNFTEYLYIDLDNYSFDIKN